MSYLSATENVGFSGIPQNISDGSCATQYKMAVEGVSGNCSEVMYIPDTSADDSTYITHLNDNFYTKFKIDPNELYTFHDSDVIAGEITVSHTEDTFVLDSDDAKPKLIDSPSKDVDVLGQFANGDVKEEVKKKVLSNGHYPPVSKTIPKETKTSHTKVQRAKGQVKEARRESSSEVRKQNAPNAQSPKSQVIVPTVSTKNVNGVDVTTENKSTIQNKSAHETFLDVFKREQGLIENEIIVPKTEPQPLPPPVKIPMSPPKKPVAKTPSSSKPRRGRGPAVHEALQRISPRKAIPLPNMTWHAPGDNLFDCGPLDTKIPAFKLMDSSSSDDDNMPDFESGYGPVSIEENVTQSRGARLAVRRAALRRHVARAHASLRLATGHHNQRALATLLKKQLNSPKSAGSLPTQTVNHLLALRGMPAVFTTQERRKLRETGWSGGESTSPSICTVDKCSARAAPCARHCMAHVSLAPEQRLYASCAAVFAGGARCRAPLLPLKDQTMLCAEHAWKRDNYDKLVKSAPPKRPRRPPAPRRPPRRRRPPAPRPPRPPPPAVTQPLSEINVCSNSSSSEDAAMGALSENEYITVVRNSHEMEVEVGHVPADDILDPAVLSQIPDEAFTEFFNQGIVLAEAGSSFGESSELAAALEAVLDERTLTEERVTTDMHHNMFVHEHSHKIPPASMTLEVSSSASS